MMNLIIYHCIVLVYKTYFDSVLNNAIMFSWKYLKHKSIWQWIIIYKMVEICKTNTSWWWYSITTNITKRVDHEVHWWASPVLSNIPRELFICGWLLLLKVSIDLLLTTNFLWQIWRLFNCKHYSLLLNKIWYSIESNQSLTLFIQI